jgi:hypothetical protein
MTIQKLPPAGTTTPNVQLTVLNTDRQTAYTKPPHLSKYTGTFSLNFALKNWMCTILEDMISYYEWQYTRRSSRLRYIICMHYVGCQAKEKPDFKNHPSSQHYYFHGLC